MFARGSFRYLATSLFLVALLTLGALWLQPQFWLAVGLALLAFLFLLWFFRDPERSVGEEVVSPADGKVLAVDAGPHEARLTIFMAPTSVHVNRCPLSGRIEQLTYHRGGHVPAFKKESERNERLELDLSTGKGPVRVRLIAGTVARRIHPYVTPGAEVKKGDRIGLIAFGSRCELVLPGSAFRFTVEPGTWVKAGETTVAREL